MRVEVNERQFDVVPGQPLLITLTITNTSEVIGGYTVRVLGADPGWVTMDVEQISLFPSELRVVPLTVTPPKGLPAGLRRIAVQVRELTPPQQTTIVDVDLNVPAERAMAVRLDPMMVTAGKRAAFSVIAENTGNTLIAGRFAGDDPEARVAFGFEPEIVHLAPGEHAIVDMRVAAKRHLAGSPLMRPLSLYFDDLPAEAFFDDPEGKVVGERGEGAAVAQATMVQKPVLSRGTFSLVGLLIAITVFAFVITLALGKLVGQSTADRNLALQVAAARNGAGTSTGTSSLNGKVTLLTTGAPLSAVSVNVYDAGDTSKPLVTTATDKGGNYHVPQLGAGKFKISFQHAGYIPLWYPAATSDADATAVELKTGEQKNGLNIALGGLPASITGSVTGDDVAGATIYLETAPGGSSGTTTNASDSTSLPNGAASTAPTSSASPGAAAPGSATDSGAAPPNPLTAGSAIVQKVPVGSDGTFALDNVPSPNVYQLVVVKTGYATTIQQLDVAGGEQRTGVQLTLRKGDGLISGTVSDAAGPLSNVTITANTGQTSVTTVSLTDKAHRGRFTLRGLPTPGSFTLTATAADHAAQTLSLTLAAGQKLTGVQITLGTSSGALSGVVTEVSTDKGGSTQQSPAAGVTVTATDGLLTVQSQTASRGDVGHWRITGLPVPGTYTLTFSRDDLTSQTVSASIDANGVVAGGPVKVAMQPSTTTVTGVVTRSCGAGLAGCTPQPVGEATVTLNAGAQSYTVTTASYPGTERGRYVIANVPPGTYTLTVTSGGGISTASQVVQVQVGTTNTADVSLNVPASVTGVVHLVHNGTDEGPPTRSWYAFLYTTANYPSVVTAVRQTDTTTGRFTFNQIDAGDYVIAIGPTKDPASTVRTVLFSARPSEAADVHTIKVAQ
jgi:hypothetical protein